MAYEITSLPALVAHGFDDVIDVRSPAEFAEDHLPGAINLPALSNEERAIVGTIYVQESAFRARKIGAAMVARNVAAHLEGPLAGRDGGWRPLVYCWRGGQRSGSVATILTQVGWRAEVVKGGYQSYRRAVVRAMYDGVWPGRVIVLDGNTGTAKTTLLHKAALRGAQVIDLEGLAAHRGSLFGPVGRPQPSQKAFEGALAMALAGLDPDRPLLVEAESSRIGDLLVPPALWKAMRAAPRLVIEAPLGARAAYLVRAYRDVIENRETLLATLGKLVTYHGREQVAAWEALAGEGRHEDLASELMALHYDPRYAKSRARSDAEGARVLASGTLDEDGLDRLADSIVAALA